MKLNHCYLIYSLIEVTLDLSFAPVLATHCIDHESASSILCICEWAVAIYYRLGLLPPLKEKNMRGICISWKGGNVVLCLEILVVPIDCYA